MNKLIFVSASVLEKLRVVVFKERIPMKKVIERIIENYVNDEKNAEMFKIKGEE